MELSAYLRTLVAGAEVKVPLDSGDYVPAINFDNAATTPPFNAVMARIANFAAWYSSIHRGKGYKSVLASDLYEEGRNVLAQFVNADKQRDHIIYTKNTTESINMLAYLLQQQDREQMILATEMEHLANDLPWREKFRVEYAAVDSDGRLSLADLENRLIKFRGKIKLVTVTGASNVVGYVNPVHDIARTAHKYGAKILVDAAQLVPHAAIDMKPCGSPEHLDYLVFSGHKMYAPFGMGVLVGPRELFDNTEPVYRGGGAVRLAGRDFIQWSEGPARDEAGTPNLMGVVAMITAIKTMQSIGLKVIHNYERYLLEYLWAGLESISHLRLYAQPVRQGQKEERVSLISFNMEDVHHNVLAEILSREAGIAVRSGMFCAHPYVQKLLQLSPEQLEYYRTTPNVPLPGMVRVSLGLYNNVQEIDALLDMLHKIVNNRPFFKHKYQHAALSAHP